MGYKCDNCKNRNTIDCEFGYHRKCEDFELDIETLSEKEKSMFLLIGEALKEVKRRRPQNEANLI